MIEGQDYEEIVTIVERPDASRIKVIRCLHCGFSTADAMDYLKHECRTVKS